MVAEFDGWCDAFAQAGQKHVWHDNSWARTTCLVEPAHSKLAIEDRMSVLLTEALLDYNYFAQKTSLPDSLQRNKDLQWQQMQCS